MSQKQSPRMTPAQPESSLSPAGSALQALSGLKGKIGAALRRVGFHVLALAVSGIIAEGNSFGAYAEQLAFLYFGLICLVPRGFSPRRTGDLLPCAISLGQLGLTLLLGYPLSLSVFMAGAQNWLQRAVLRRFQLGLDWVLLPVLLGGFTQNVRAYDFPFVFFAFTAVCGLAACYAARTLDMRKLAGLEAEAEARAEKSSPFRQFYLSAADLETKAAALPEGLSAHVSAIVLSGRNILECMGADPQDSQIGSRFLSRYLPAAHTLVDEYVRLGRDGRGQQDIESVLERVDETLERLALAFKREHGSLLSNDARQLSAEMQVLDKLLKMDGR